jgi:hypothetical protein
VVESPLVAIRSNFSASDSSVEEVVVEAPEAFNFFPAESFFRFEEDDIPFISVVVVAAEEGVPNEAEAVVMVDSTADDVVMFGEGSPLTPNTLLL